MRNPSICEEDISCCLLYSLETGTITEQEAHLFQTGWLPSEFLESAHLYHLMTRLHACGTMFSFSVYARNSNTRLHIRHLYRLTHLPSLQSTFSIAFGNYHFSTKISQKTQIHVTVHLTFDFPYVTNSTSKLVF